MSSVRLWLVAAAGLLAGLGALLVFGSCNTPFIPLPPPGDPTFTPLTNSDGMAARTLWEVRGNPASEMSEAEVSVFNIDAGSGVIVRAAADGSYVSNSLEGRPGDRIQLRYDTQDGRRSPDICRVLQQGKAQTTCTP